MFVLVIGGGKVGYYLTKELIGSGHEVVLMEKDHDRANQIADEIGSIVISHDGCEGKYLAEAGANRADIVAAVEDPGHGAPGHPGRRRHIVDGGTAGGAATWFGHDDIVHQR